MHRTGAAKEEGGAARRGRIDTLPLFPDAGLERIRGRLHSPHARRHSPSFSPTLLPMARNKAHLRVLAAGFARALHQRCSLLGNGGRRECRVHAAPAVSCAVSAKRYAHEHTGEAEAVRHPLRSGSTAYTALSLVSEFVLSPSSADWRPSQPGRIKRASTDLAPATGVRTTRLRRTDSAGRRARRVSLTSFLALQFTRAPDAIASTASRSQRLMTIAKRPSWREQDGAEHTRMPISVKTNFV